MASIVSKLFLDFWIFFIFTRSLRGLHVAVFRLFTDLIINSTSLQIQIVTPA